MKKLRAFYASALSICACATIFAGNNPLDSALNEYAKAARSCNRATYTAACAKLLAAAQNSSHEDAKIAYETVHSTAALFDPFPYAMAALLGIANISGKVNPCSLAHTGLHFFSDSRNNNIYRIARIAANALAGVGIAIDIYYAHWALNYFSNREPFYVYAAGTGLSMIAWCLTLYGSYERHIMTEQHDLLLEKLLNIVEEKASQQVA